MAVKPGLIFLGACLLAGCAAPSTNYDQADLSDSHVEISRHILDNSPELDIKEGLFLLRGGSLRAATDQFNRALQKDAQNSYYHYLAALSYHLRMLDGEADQRDLAEKGYEIAIALDPTNWLATYQLALFYQDLRRWDKAMNYWLETINFRGEDPEVLRNGIYAAYYARNLTIARNLLKPYEQVETDRNAYNELAAIILAASGEVEQAQARLAQLPEPVKDRLSGRVKNWSELHELAQTRFAEQASFADETSEPLDTSNDDFDDSDHDEWDDEYDDEHEEELEPIRALAVDVVIIRTTEEIGSSRGINILRELQVSLGNNGDDGYVDSRTRETTRTDSIFFDEEGTAFPGGTSIDFNETDVISKAVSIPTINYSLNIANVTGTRNEVLARPTLIAQDGEESSFFSGSHINAVAVGGSNSDGATESIDVDVGVLLRIGAEFHSDNEFTLNVEAERTFLQEPNRSAVTFPLFVSYSKTRAEATVRMRFGQSLILSGLSEKETSRSRDGVPILGDLPVIQYLFNKRGTRDFQSSVVLLITPHQPQYIYSDEGGNQPLSELQGLFGTHWEPYPNITQVFQHMESNRLFREFRTGDVRVEKWLTQESFSNRLRAVQYFIFEL